VINRCVEPDALSLVLCRILVAVLIRKLYFYPELYPHMIEVCDSFYISNDRDAHRVASVSYSQDGESVSTFCGNEFEIESQKEIIEVPIRLLRKDEVCAECERNHSFINYERFNFDEEEFEYKFFFRATIRLGDKKGFMISETVGADTESEARDKIESIIDRSTSTTGHRTRG
jgi:hypothetical protein